MKKQNKTLPPISVTLKNRADWLWEWVKLRGYNFDSNDRRNTFLYVYFLTWMQAYNNYNLAYAMTHRRNHQLDKALKSTDLDKKIRVWNQPKYNHKFTNEALIRLLAITSDEVETLKIGYNKKLMTEIIFLPLVYRWKLIRLRMTVKAFALMCTVIMCNRKLLLTTPQGQVRVQAATSLLRLQVQQQNLLPLLTQNPHPIITLAVLLWYGFQAQVQSITATLGAVV